MSWNQQRFPYRGRRFRFNRQGRQRPPLLRYPTNTSAYWDFHQQPYNNSNPPPLNNHGPPRYQFPKSPLLTHPPDLTQSTNTSQSTYVNQPYDEDESFSLPLRHENRFQEKIPDQVVRTRYFKADKPGPTRKYYMKNQHCLLATPDALPNTITEDMDMSADTTEQSSGETTKVQAVRTSCAETTVTASSTKSQGDKHMSSVVNVCPLLPLPYDLVLAEWDLAEKEDQYGSQNVVDEHKLEPLKGDGGRGESLKLESQSSMSECNSQDQQLKETPESNVEVTGQSLQPLSSSPATRHTDDITPKEVLSSEPTPEPLTISQSCTSPVPPHKPSEMELPGSPSASVEISSSAKVQQFSPDISDQTEQFWPIENVEDIALPAQPKATDGTDQSLSLYTVPSTLPSEILPSQPKILNEVYQTLPNQSLLSSVQPVAPEIANQQLPVLPVAPEIANKQLPVLPVAQEIANKQLPVLPVAPEIANKQLPVLPVAPEIANQQLPVLPVAPKIANQQWPVLPVAPEIANQQLPVLPVAPEIVNQQLPVLPMAPEMANQQSPVLPVVPKIANQQKLPVQPVAPEMASQQLPVLPVAPKISTKQLPVQPVAPEIANQQLPVQSVVLERVNQQSAIQPVAPEIANQQLPVQSVVPERANQQSVTPNVANKTLPVQPVTPNVVSQPLPIQQVTPILPEMADQYKVTGQLSANVTPVMSNAEDSSIHSPNHSSNRSDSIVATASVGVFTVPNEPSPLDDLSYSMEQSVDSATVISDTKFKRLVWDIYQKYFAKVQIDKVQQYLLVKLYKLLNYRINPRKFEQTEVLSCKVCQQKIRTMLAYYQHMESIQHMKKLKAMLVTEKAFGLKLLRESVEGKAGFCEVCIDSDWTTSCREHIRSESHCLRKSEILTFISGMSQSLQGDGTSKKKFRQRDAKLFNSMVRGQIEAVDPNINEEVQFRCQIQCRKDDQTFTTVESYLDHVQSPHHMIHLYMQIKNYYSGAFHQFIDLDSYSTHRYFCEVCPIRRPFNTLRPGTLRDHLTSAEHKLNARVLLNLCLMSNCKKYCQCFIWKSPKAQRVVESRSAETRPARSDKDSPISIIPTGKNMLATPGISSFGKHAIKADSTVTKKNISGVNTRKRIISTSMSTELPSTEEVSSEVQRKIVHPNDSPIVISSTNSSSASFEVSSSTAITPQKHTKSSDSFESVTIRSDKLGCDKIPLAYRRSRSKERRSVSNERKLKHFNRQYALKMNRNTRYRWNKNASREGRSRSWERRSRSRDERSRFGKKYFRSRGKMSRSRGKRTWSRNRGYRSRNRRSRSRDKRSRSWDHRSRSRDKRSYSRDTKSRSRDRSKSRESSRYRVQEGRSISNERWPQLRETRSRSKESKHFSKRKRSRSQDGSGAEKTLYKSHKKSQKSEGRYSDESRSSSHGRNSKSRQISSRPSRLDYMKEKSRMKTHLRSRSPKLKYKRNNSVSSERKSEYDRFSSRSRSGQRQSTTSRSRDRTPQISRIRSKSRRSRSSSQRSRSSSCSIRSRSKDKQLKSKSAILKFRKLGISSNSTQSILDDRKGSRSQFPGRIQHKNASSYSSRDGDSYSSNSSSSLSRSRSPRIFRRKRSSRSFSTSSERSGLNVYHQTRCISPPLFPPRQSTSIYPVASESRRLVMRALSPMSSDTVKQTVENAWRFYCNRYYDTPILSSDMVLESQIAYLKSYSGFFVEAPNFENCYSNLNKPHDLKDAMQLRLERFSPGPTESNMHGSKSLDGTNLVSQDIRAWRQEMVHDIIHSNTENCSSSLPVVPKGALDAASGMETLIKAGSIPGLTMIEDETYTCNRASIDDIPSIEGLGSPKIQPYLRASDIFPNTSVVIPFLNDDSEYPPTSSSTIIPVNSSEDGKPSKANILDRHSSVLASSCGTSDTSKGVSTDSTSSKSSLRKAIPFIDKDEYPLSHSSPRVHIDHEDGSDAVAFSSFRIPASQVTSSLNEYPDQPITMPNVSIDNQFETVKSDGKPSNYVPTPYSCVAENEMMAAKNQSMSSVTGKLSVKESPVAKADVSSVSLTDQKDVAMSAFITDVIQGIIRLAALQENPDLTADELELKTEEEQELMHSQMVTPAGHCLIKMAQCQLENPDRLATDFEWAGTEAVQIMKSIDERVVELIANTPILTE